MRLTLAFVAAVSLLSCAAPDPAPPDAGPAPIPVGELRGRVLVDDGGGVRPAAAAVVALERGSVAVPADGDGRFVLAAIPVGDVTLSISLDLDGDGGPDVARRVDVTLSSSAGLDVGDVTLGALGSLAVTVVRGSTVVPAARVVVEPWTEASTDAEGKASLRNLVPGRHVVVAVTGESSGWTPWRGVAVEVAPGTSTPLTLDLATLEVTEPAALEGRARTSTGAPGVIRIHVGEEVTEANAEGDFSFPRGRVPSGIYTLLAESDGFALVVLPRVVVGSDASRVGTLTLGAGADCGPGPDADHDGVTDADEPAACRCRPGAADIDTDRICDDVDADLDNDGIDDFLDNCLGFVNPDQANGDGDAAGDACDGDDDGDTVDDGDDNCPLTANTDQRDLDADALGDACDPNPGVDGDSDEVEDSLDNCVGVTNGDQANADGDDFGDVCDSDDDEDAILDGGDNCPFTPNPSQDDLDADMVGDACDPAPGVDDDGDRVEDSLDNCLGIANPGQANGDHDPLGDACDPDDDDDTVDDADDNCPRLANTNQSDLDRDGTGDACDATPGTDTDGDGVGDVYDNCPLAPNPGQADSNNDGTGDACTVVLPPVPAVLAPGCRGTTCNALAGAPAADVLRIFSFGSDLYRFGESGDLLRYDGAQWTFEEYPMLALRDGGRFVRDVNRVGTHLWAVGDGGLIARKDAGGWNTLTAPAPLAAADAWIVEGLAENDVFIATANFELLHWNGGALEVVEAAPELLSAYPGTGAFILERFTSMPLRWDGLSFVSMAFDDQAGALSPFGLRATPSGLWMYGNNSGAGMFLSRWDGTAWTTTIFPNGTIIDVASPGPGQAFVLFDTGAVMHWNGSNFSLATFMPPMSGYPVLAFPSGPGRFFGVGLHGALAEYDHATGTWTTGPQARDPRASDLDVAPDGTVRTLDASRGLILRREPTGWVVDHPPTVASADCMLTLPDGERWVAAYGVEIWRKPVNGAWTEVTGHGLVRSPRYIAGSGPNDIWVWSSSFSKLVHWDGTAWETWTGTTQSGTRGMKAFPGVMYMLRNGTVQRWTTGPLATTTVVTGTVAFNAIEGSSPSNLWAVGQSGRVVRTTNGTTFTTVPAPAGHTGNYHSVWTSDPANVWIAGSAGQLARWDGTNLVAQQSPTTQLTPELRGNAANDLWMAAYAVHHYDGTRWTVDTAESSTDGSIRAGTIVSPTLGFFEVGYAGARWDGTKLLGEPIELEDAIVGGIAAHGATDALAVGRNLASYYNGTTWTREVAAPTGSYLYEVAKGLTPGEYWAIGSGPVFRRAPSGTWTQEEPGGTPMATSERQLAVASDGRVLVAGVDEFLSIRAPTGGWTVQTSPPCRAAFPNSVTFLDATVVPDPGGDGFAVVGSSCFATYRAGTWSVVPLPMETIQLNAVAATGWGDIWLGGGVGNAGFLWRWDGTQFHRIAMPYGEMVLQLLPAPGQSLYAVVNPSVLLKLR